MLNRFNIILTLSTILVSYVLFYIGLYITSLFVLGEGIFDNVEDLKTSVNSTVWYVDFIVCSILAFLVGLFTGLLVAGNDSWKVALLSTIPIFAYLHLTKFPKLEVSIVGEAIRGGRYVIIGTMTALLISRLKYRVMKRTQHGNDDLPRYG
jgi:hypothetical protein